MKFPFSTISGDSNGLFIETSIEISGWLFASPSLEGAGRSLEFKYDQYNVSLDERGGSPNGTSGPSLGLRGGYCRKCETRVSAVPKICVFSLGRDSMRVRNIFLLLNVSIKFYQYLSLVSYKGKKRSTSYFINLKALLEIEIEFGCRSIIYDWCLEIIIE
jgi:hypothetical protein